MKIFLFFLILLKFIFPASIFAEKIQVSEIKIVGNDRIETEVIKREIKLDIKNIDSEKVNQTVKDVYKLGFFENIITKLEVEDGKQILVFEVKERPYIRKIFLDGNKAASGDDLAEVLKFKETRFVDPLYIHSLIQGAELYYQTLGYLDAKIKYKTEVVDSGQVDLIFEIDEGKKFKIKKVTVNSEGKVNEDEIISLLQTKRYKWWSSWLFGTGKVNQAYLEADRNLIQNYLLDNGFVNGKVSSGQIERKEDRLVVNFDIEEGEVFYLGKILATGDLINDSLDDTLKIIQIKEGDVFNASKVRETSFKLSDEYADYGYAFANVVPETDINFKEKKVAITFNISKGKLVKINKIKISGNTKTYDNVIRREIRVDEQDTFSRVEIEKSAVRLRRTGFFNDVSINPEAVENQDDKVDLNVNVQEASTGTFSIGGGYSSADGGLFNAQLAENNFMGTGRTTRLEASIGAQTENMILGIDDPRFNDTFWRFGIEGFKTERMFIDFDRDLTGGSFTFGYPLERFFGKWSEDIDFSIKYQYMNTEIFNIDPDDAAQLVIDSEGKSSASGFIPRLRRTTIDNIMNPTSGSRQTLTTEYMGIGGEENYYVLEFRNDYFVPLMNWGNDKLVFSWRFNIGYGDTLDGEVFPLFRRYFPGGINSVRGFENRSLGPRDENGNEYGGSKQIINNLEFIFPLVSSAGLRGVVFYDMGDAFDDDVNYSFSDLRKAYGFGIRWASPMGPIRIEIGYPVDPIDGETGAVTLFSFGSPLF